MAGIDEVGRGPLAGPVTAAAVVMPEDIPGTWFGLIRDSKQMSSQRREFASGQIQLHARAVGVGSGSPAEVDTLGIVAATRLAMTRALDNLGVTPDHLLIDALTLPAITVPQTPIVKGDAISISIAAASIVAKVTRDRLMAESYEPRHPGYGFARKQGIRDGRTHGGTTGTWPLPHPQAILCAGALGRIPEAGSLMGTLRLPSGTGRAGEAAAAAHLRRLDYKIVERNYRVREGEIDIVAEHSGDLVFVEVKARRSSAFGKPEESLTEEKAARLVAAAQTYLADRGLEQADWRIDLVAVELDRAGRAERVEVIRDAVTG